MSQPNADLVLRSWKAFADGGLDALAEFWDPDINWRAIEGAPDDVGEMHGPEALRRYFGEWIEMFDDLSLEMQQLLEVGDDLVVTTQRASGRAKLSGIETELVYAVVYTIRDGKIARGREYLTLEEALETVKTRE